MADWNWHVALAKRVMQDIDIINKYDFILGSIAPDYPWIPVNDCIQLGCRNESHNYVRHHMCHGAVAVVNEWLSRHIADVRASDFWKGVLTHIVLDNELSTTFQITHCYHSSGRISMVVPGGDIALVSKDEHYHSKWDSINNFSLSQFGIQTDWIEEKSSWLSKEAAEILCKNYGVSESVFDDLVIKMLKQWPTEMCSDGYVPNTVTRYYSSIHMNVVARCILYINLMNY